MAHDGLYVRLVCFCDLLRLLAISCSLCHLYLRKLFVSRPPSNFPSSHNRFLELTVFMLGLLRHNGVHPVMVLDGLPLPLKEKTNESRQRSTLWLLLFLL